MMNDAAKAHSLNMEALSNARDLGGYTGYDGKKIVKGRLLRTAMLADASEEDIKKLVDKYQLKLIIDLREAGEAERKPDPEFPGVRYVHIDVMDPEKFGNNSERDAIRQAEKTFEDYAAEFSGFTERPDFGKLYEIILQSRIGKEGFSRVFREILDTPDGAVLIHCSAGKDRTGIAAALILTALGVDPDTIMKDYLLTNVFCEQRIEETRNKLIEAGFAEDRASRISSVWEGAKAEMMDTGLRSMKQSDGSVMGYLKKQLNLSDEEIGLLRSRYLE